MSYSKKVVLLIFLLVTAGIFSVLHRVLPRVIGYRPCVIGTLSLQVPAHMTLSEYRKEGWTGRQGTGGASWIYCLFREARTGLQLTSLLPRGAGVSSWPLAPGVVFAVQARGKGYRRYIYLLHVADRVLWLESGASASSLILVKEMADTMLTSLTLEGRKPLDRPEVLARLAGERIPWTTSQSFSFFILLTAGVMVFTYTVVLLISALSSRAPVRFEVAPARTVRGVTVKMNYRPLGVQMQDALLAVHPGRLDIYVFRKALFGLKTGDSSRFRMRRGRTFLLRQAYLAFAFPDPVDIRLPGRNRTVKTHRVTLYMNPEEIDRLLLELGIHLPPEPD